VVASIEAHSHDCPGGGSETKTPYPARGQTGVINRVNCGGFGRTPSPHASFEQTQRIRDRNGSATREEPATPRFTRPAIPLEQRRHLS
jgi:hypothetical protein